MHRTIFLLILLAIVGLHLIDMSPLSWSVYGEEESELGFRLPEGFSIHVAATDELVHDAFCLTTDALGNPVISGPGYVRTLVDSNADGVYERAVDLGVNVPQGAQGLWCERGSYYYVAESGLWLAEDKNGDFIADGSPRKVLQIPTGGEHDSHAIRRGPDGWWYLIVGNFAADIGKLKNDPASPVAQPRAGTLWRISPDFSKRGVWAHGLRNAYDFDFFADGSVVTYDSDEERELTLPWYRPTRVSILSAGSDAGWLDSAWSDLDSRVTMPQVLARLGRGSPTGVKVYDHNQFPAKYHQAIFVEDWTFGRIVAVYPQPPDSSDAAASEAAPGKASRFFSETFLQPEGTTGFAPTDLTIAPDGSLLVCTGGRGTTGTLYRIQYDANAAATDESQTAEDAVDPAIKKNLLENSSMDIASALELPSPWEAWSREQWERVWKSATIEERTSAIQGKSLVADKQTIAPEKVHLSPSSLQRRAIQYEVDLKNRSVVRDAATSTTSTLKGLLAVTNPSSMTEVKQASWWGLGHLSTTSAELNTLVKQIDALTEIEQEECFRSEVFGAWDKLVGEPVIRSFYECIGLCKGDLPSSNLWEKHRLFVQKPDDALPESPKYYRTLETQRSVRQSQLWAASRTVLPGEEVIKRNADSSSNSDIIQQLDRATGKRLYGAASNSIDAGLMDQFAKIVSKKMVAKNIPENLEALSTLQASLGDYRNAVPTQQAPAAIDVLDGYRTNYALKAPDAIRDGWVKWCISVANEKGSTASPEAWNATVKIEAMRSMAMLSPTIPEALQFCFDQFTPNSHPTTDIHTLVVISCCTSKRNIEQTSATANALTGVLQKVRALNLNTESRWGVRLEQLWKHLVERDPMLPTAFVDRKEFGTEDDLQWLRWCPPEIQKSGRLKLVNQLAELSPENWNPELARYVWEGSKTIDPRLLARLRQVDGESSKILTANTPPNSTESYGDLLALELLAVTPGQQDYPRFLAALESGKRSRRVVGWKGISPLQPDQPQRELIALTILWHSLIVAPRTEISTAAIAKRIRTFGTKFGLSNIPASDAWSAWEPLLQKSLGDKFPPLAKIEYRPKLPWRETLTQSSQKGGRIDMGLAVFQQAKCNYCHVGGSGSVAKSTSGSLSRTKIVSGNNILGPSLTGVARRFSKEDLFLAIYEPSKDISDRYKATKILTTQGNVVVGMKVYDSVDGVTLQAANGRLIRINQADIEEKEAANLSLMPEGLLDGFSPQDVADLYAYLQSL